MKNEIVLLTGATGKIGMSFISGLVNDGLRVVCCTRDAQAATAKIGEMSKAITFIEVNFFNQDYWGRIDSFLNENNLKINHFVHAARSLDSLKVETSGFSSDGNFRKELELQVIVPYKIITNLLQKQPDALKSIVSIGSIYGSSTFNRNLDLGDLNKAPIQYAVSKAALGHLTRELAARYPNLKINQISYGGIEGRVDQDFLSRYGKLCPMGRMLKEDEVYGALKFLISKDSNYILGQDIKVDGGWSLW